MTTKKKQKGGLAGIGNKALHQYIISDLIFGIRKRLIKTRLAKKYAVLSEITISQIGYDLAANNFKNDYNIDLVVVEEPNHDIKVLIEIERKGFNAKNTELKIEECLRKIPTIDEAYIIRFDMTGNTSFELCTLNQKKKLVKTSVNSKSNFLNMSFKTSLVSLKGK